LDKVYDIENIDYNDLYWFRV